MAPRHRLGALAELLGARLVGDPNRLIDGVRGLADAGPDHISFLANRRYARQLATSEAGAVLVRQDDAVEDGPCLLHVDDPYVAFAHVLALFHPQRWPAPGVHPLACVAEDAVLEGVHVAAFAWVGPGAVVGPGSWLETGAVVGEGARVGRRCRLMAHSVVAEGSVLGDRVWLNPGAVVGAEGFGFAPSADGPHKIPQVGGVVLGDDVELGANTCVDRAALPGAVTIVGARTKTDNLVQIGHGAQIGESVLMVAYSGVAGSAKVGDHSMLAAKAAVLPSRVLGAGVQVGVASVVHDDQPDGAQVSGIPAIPHKAWLRSAAAARHVPDLLRTVRRLEARVAALEAALPPGTEG